MKPYTRDNRFWVAVYRSQSCLGLKVVTYNELWSNYGKYELWTINTVFYLLYSKFTQLNEKSLHLQFKYCDDFFRACCNFIPQ